MLFAHLADLKPKTKNMRKLNSFAVTALVMLTVLLSSCEAIAGIFKAGMGVGIFLVIAVVIVIVVVTRRMGKK